MGCFLRVSVRVRCWYITQGGSLMLWGSPPHFGSRRRRRVEKARVVHWEMHFWHARPNIFKSISHFEIYPGSNNKYVCHWAYKKPCSGLWGRSPAIVNRVIHNDTLGATFCVFPIANRAEKCKSFLTTFTTNVLHAFTRWHWGSGERLLHGWALVWCAVCWQVHHCLWPQKSCAESTSSKPTANICGQWHQICKI